MSKRPGKTSSRARGSTPPRRAAGPRKVIFGVACSLDLFIAREDHAVDWILWSDEARSLMHDFWKTIDAMVMGRRTYEVMLGHGAGAGGRGRMKTYVLSRSLKPDPARERGVEIITGDAVDFMADLRAGSGRDICLMGGGVVARPLLAAGLVDELGLNIHPVLLGSGIPLFHGFERQIDLELIESRRFSNGCVYSSYRVKH